jgi:adenylate kinase
MANAPLVVITGAPSSGKTTQVDKLLDAFGTHVQKLDLNRLLKSKVDEYPIIKQLIQKGKLKTQMPVEISAMILSEAIQNGESKFNLFYRGPASVEEAKAFPKPNLVIVLNMPDKETIIERVANRRVDETTGKTYHLVNDREEINRLGIRSRLTQRFGDDRELLSQRLKRYDEKMESVINYYQQTTQVAIVDGQRSVEEVFQEVYELVKSVFNTH